MCSCLVLMCVCHLKREAIADLEAAAAAVNEALEIRPRHAPALYRRSQVRELNAIN